jgi:hypothetical protein
MITRLSDPVEETIKATVQATWSRSKSVVKSNLQWLWSRGRISERNSFIISDICNNSASLSCTCIHYIYSVHSVQVSREAGNQALAIRTRSGHLDTFAPFLAAIFSGGLRHA